MFNSIIAPAVALAAALLVGAGIFNAGVEKGKEVALDLLNELGLQVKEVHGDE